MGFGSRSSLSRCFLIRNAHVENELIAIAAIKHVPSVQFLDDNARDVSFLARLRLDIASMGHALVSVYVSAK